MIYVLFRSKLKQGQRIEDITENSKLWGLDFGKWASIIRPSLPTSQNSGKENKGKKRPTEPMESLIKEFAEEEFSNLNSENNTIDIDMLVQPLILILHSHRYKKNEQFTKGKDFSVIRDLLYCYSEEAKERFMSNPILSFIFDHFKEKTN